MKRKTRSTKKATTRKPAVKRKFTPEGQAAQEALQITWQLKGRLKSERIACLQIGGLLSQVRDRKLYIKLDHTDMEDYAEKRLNLGRASLYRYLQVYDWVRENHKEWLEPKPKGFIPDFNDIADLMWIESELAKKNISAEARTGLEGLKAKALNGKLLDKDLNAWRKKGMKSAGDGLKNLLSKLRLMRRRTPDIKNVPEEALKLMDSLIELIRNAIATG